MNSSINHASSLTGPFLFTMIGMLFILLIVMLVAIWKVYEKAGLAGWKSIVPFYNMYCLTLIARIPWWVFLLFFVPYINTAAMIYTYFKIGKRFGFGDGMAIGTAILPFIFLPIIAFGKAEYIWEDAAPQTQVAPPANGAQAQPTQTA